MEGFQEAVSSELRPAAWAGLKQRQTNQDCGPKALVTEQGRKAVSGPVNSQVGLKPEGTLKAIY